MKKILVPIDYSDASEHALQLATDLAVKTDAILELLHVYQIPSDIYPYTLFITEEIEQQIHERETERIDAWCEKARAEGRIAVGHVVRGATHDEIPAIARELGVDLIVIGTRGTTGLRRAFLGSTAERTVQLAHCPVITTH